MIDHYNAFISYKHAPEDNKVAETIHKGLERFHIPKKIQKQTGIKRINRIFRDKDELPITSDLNDTIAHALANSDYLIVICSTNTKESAWVPREIEYFLRNHTKQQIYTVLVNGEPYDVIPEMLLYEDKVMTNQNGQQEVFRMPIEPLSCDYRMPHRKADKIELPRLASGLIGCSYDELMNRRRQYKVKQMTMAFSAALLLTLSFSGYMYYSRNTIRKNYLESLRNQSKYLANESENYLEKEQRITALQLALEALPENEEDDRPVTAEAVRALNKATLAYVGNASENVNAAWNYLMPNYVTDFRVSSSGKTIAIRDAGKSVGIWNTDTHEKILFIDDITSTIEGMEYLNDSSLVIWTEKAMYCYNAYDGTKLWEHTLDEEVFKNQETMMLTEKSIFVATGSGEYLEIESSTGNVLNTVSLSKYIEDNGILSSTLSPDNNKIAFTVLIGWAEYAYGICDITTGKVVMSDTLETRVKDIAWIDNDTLMVGEYVTDLFGGSMSYGTLDILTDSKTVLHCINSSDLKEKWKADFICSDVNINSGFVGLGKNNETVAYYSGNVADIYESKTGKLLHHYNLNDSVVDVSDTNFDGQPVFITRNGGYAYTSSQDDTDSVYYRKYFADELEEIAINNGVYVRQNNSSEVIFYGIHEYDKNWQLLNDEAVYSTYITNPYMDENVLAFITREEGGLLLSIFNFDKGGEFIKKELTGDTLVNYAVLGAYNGRLYLGHSDISLYEVISVDIDTGEMTTDPVVTDQTHIKEPNKLVNSKLVYSYSEDGNEKLVIYDVETKEFNKINIQSSIGTERKDITYYEKMGSILYTGDVNFLVDAKTNEIADIKVPEGWVKTTIISENSDGNTIALTDDQVIILVNKKGEVTAKIKCPGLNPLGMAYYEAKNQLVVFYNNGGMYWYSTNGEFIRKAEASMVYPYSGTVSFDFDENSKNLYIQMDVLTDVIDIESGVEIAHIAGGFGYHKSSDTFVTQAYDDERQTRIGYYKRYTVDELIEKARDILQGAELSDELKSQYGIED